MVGSHQLGATEMLCPNWKYWPNRNARTQRSALRGMGFLVRSVLLEVKHERAIVGDVKQRATIASTATRAAGTVDKAQ